MYVAYFGLRDNPFSITPDPSDLFMSANHREALAHLLYGTGESGGFVQLTGEVGTGKTTLIRTLLAQQLENVDVALCLNPKLTVEEFVAAVCDELHIDYPRPSTTLKPLVDALNTHLLKTHAQGRQTVLIIDEAQNLSREVLEQVRLLTNLETHRHKLLRIILVGQPELQRLLERQDMRQLAQRITARYHLKPLGRQESAAYIMHRLQVAGGRTDLFTTGALKSAYNLTQGVPRLLNVICDRALLGAYGQGLKRVNAATLRRAAREALQGRTATSSRQGWLAWLAVGILLAGVSGAGLYPSLNILLPALPELMAVVSQAPAPPQPTATAPPGEPATAPPSEPATAPPSEPATPVKPAATAPPAQAQEQSLESVFDTAATDDAMSKLLAAWGEEPTLPVGIPPCDYVRDHALRCLTGRASWDEVRRHNRPVILRLATPRGDTRQVLLRSLDGETAILELTDGPLRTSLALLNLLWTGDYLLLWRPQIPLDLFSPGYRGEAVKWLRRQLALVESSPPPAEPPADFFDSALREHVQRFQRAYNLQADGIVGNRTLAYLHNLAPVPGTPSLTPPVAGRGQ
jgi:general secretion pathway protein A